MAERAQIDELVKKMTEERERLLAILEGMSEAEASRPDGDDWSAKQQMSHLCEMEAAYRAWVERALEEDGANVDGVRGEPPAIPLEQANDRSAAEHIGEMRRQREATMGLIQSIRPEDYERRASNRIFGALTVMQWLRSYYRHDRMHCDQLEGRDSSYRPQYAGGKEPDQRR